MPARLIESLATTEPLAELFSDRSVLQAMLDFEVALARAEARAGIVPAAAAEHIAAVAKAEAFDIPTLTGEIFRAGTAAIPVVKALTEKTRSRAPDAAGFVHWGATSQDVADTAIVLLLKRAQPLLANDLDPLEAALAGLSDQHKKTPMLGRTLMQAAPPVTFGLKAAGWLASIHRSRTSMDAAFDQALVVQFGGASGTLASLGENGIPVTKLLAAELGLGCPEAPWHTQRDRLANLMCCCAVLTGSLGKMAEDVSLLMQNEVAEAAEPSGPRRGGSSTMPHKRNPVGCSLALAAAHRVPALAAAFLSSMVQQHERAVGGWQAEWPVIASIVQSTGLAAASMKEVAQGLSVDPGRMRANLDSTKGVIFAERAMMLLGAKLGRDIAHKVLEEATRKSVAQGRHLAEVLGEMPEVTSRLEPSILQTLEDPEHYLGSAEAFRQALLAASNAPKKNQ